MIVLHTELSSEFLSYNKRTIKLNIHIDSGFLLESEIPYGFIFKQKFFYIVINVCIHEWF